MAQIELSLLNETDFSPKSPELIETLELILRRLGRVGKVEVELLLVGDEKIQSLNKQYRDKNQPTDVLSFPAKEGDAENFLGSIVISVDTAEHQAKQAGITVTKELKTLLGHGFLHLLGYHHR